MGTVRTVVFAPAVLAGLLGCSGSDDESGGGSGGAPVVVKPDASPVNVQGVIMELTAFVAVENATVCVLGAEPAVCTASDVSGSFSLVTAADDEIALDIQSDGNAHTIVPVASRDGDGFVDARTVAQSALDGLVDLIGVAADPAKGHLFVLRSTQGATATLSSGDSPVYFGPGGVPTGGTVTGQFGGFGFFNVTPDTFEVGLQSSKLCELPLWTGTGPGTGRVPIVAGALTTVNRVYCE